MKIYDVDSQSKYYNETELEQTLENAYLWKTERGARQCADDLGDMLCPPPKNKVIPVHVVESRTALWK